MCVGAPATSHTSRYASSLQPSHPRRNAIGVPSGESISQRLWGSKGISPSLKKTDASKKIRVRKSSKITGLEALFSPLARQPTCGAPAAPSSNGLSDRRNRIRATDHHLLDSHSARDDPSSCLPHALPPTCACKRFVCARFTFQLFFIAAYASYDLHARQPSPYGLNAVPLAS